MGLVTCLGTSVSTTWSALLERRSGIGPIRCFVPEPSFPSRIAGEIQDVPACPDLTAREAKRTERFVLLALIAGRQAMAAARLEVGRALPHCRVGVCVGSGIGGMQAMEQEHRTLLHRGHHRVGPFFVPRLICNMAAGRLSIALGAQGPNLAPATACAAGAHAIGEGLRLIQHGYADAVVAGGTEAAITPLCLAGFVAMRSTSTHRNDSPASASRPFDRRRDGFVIAEGAGMVVLEAEELAKQRGAEIVCELAGYGASSDATDIVAPHPAGHGAELAMRGALADAALGADQIAYVNAHATATVDGDLAELRALERVFGARSTPVWVGATKSMTGHALGASGAIEAAITALAVARGTIPPALNLEEPEATEGILLVQNEVMKAPVRAAISNSFGFGGTNAALVLREWRD
ncbi:MAG: beta-ketoacyl-ACP synthase II [Candidatus Schekmanbacteria bacterium]|nr:beta-ketoacyl-ACP synthase II [Candidatus Schekmanbacteria bacterium]